MRPRPAVGLYAEETPHVVEEEQKITAVIFHSGQHNKLRYDRQAVLPGGLACAIRMEPIVLKESCLKSR